MAREIIVGPHKYRIDPDNPLVVEIQHNQQGRWLTYAIFDTRQEAKRALTNLEADGAGNRNH